MFSSLNKRRLLSLGLSLAILSGCTSVDLGESEEHQVSPADEASQNVDANGMNGGNANGVNGHDITPIEGQDPNADPLNDPNSPLAQRDIFFEFDSFAILPEYIVTSTSCWKATPTNSAAANTTSPSARNVPMPCAVP